MHGRMVKRQNDNTPPGLGRGRLVPSSHKRSEFKYVVIRWSEQNESYMSVLIEKSVQRVTVWHYEALPSDAKL